MSEIINNAKQRMNLSIESFQNELAKVRTGRAHPSLLENIKVDSYGSIVPLSQVGSVVVEDSQTLLINVWDKSQVAAVEKSIVTSDLGLNPNVNGVAIRVVLPPLTQERRLQLVKVVKSNGETAKVSIRNIRRDILSEVKNQKKDKLITEDDERSLQADAQKITDDFIAKIDKILAKKESELTSI